VVAAALRPETSAKTSDDPGDENKNTDSVRSSDVLQFTPRTKITCTDVSNVRNAQYFATAQASLAKFDNIDDEYILGIPCP